MHQIMLNPSSSRDSKFEESRHPSQVIDLNHEANFSPKHLSYLFWEASMPLILVASRAPFLTPDLDPSKLQKKLIQEMQVFEKSLQKKNIRAEQIMIAKYFLCALVDESLEFEWLKGHGFWKAHALLYHFFQETSADEKFFTLLARLQKEPSVNLPLLELAYMSLVYGFQGKYRQMDAGHLLINQLMSAVYHQLNWYYDELRKSLFIHAKTATFR